MKFLLLVLSLSIVGFCSGASISQFADIKYQSYSNLSDPAFRSSHGVEFVTNYWDAARRSMVYKGMCRAQATKDYGVVTQIHGWVEEDKKVVELQSTFSHAAQYKSYEGDIEDSPAVIVMKAMQSAILKTEGLEVIDSTKNMKYRGDSAKRCMDAYKTGNDRVRHDCHSKLPQ